MIRLGPTIGRKSNFHSREKCLIGLVLATLCLLCFASIFLLPDNFGSEGVLRVYKQLQKAGPEIFIPAPPLATRPGGEQVIRSHNDREKLEAKIREEMGDSLDKPQLQRETNHDDNLSANSNQMGEHGDGGVGDGGGGGEMNIVYLPRPQAALPQTGLPPPPQPPPQPSAKHRPHHRDFYQHDSMMAAAPAATRNNSSSTLSSNDEQAAAAAAAAGLDTNNLPLGNVNLQMPFGGHSDSDPKVDMKRQKVLQVSTLN